MHTTHSFTVGKFTVTPMAQAMHNGEWLSKASIAQADSEPAEAHVHTFDGPSVSEADAMAYAEQEGRSQALAMSSAA